MRVILLLTLVATGLAAVNIRQVNSRTARKFITPPQNSDMAAGTNFVFSFLNSHLFPNDSSFTENLFVTITNPSASVAQVSITSKYEGFNTTNVTVPPKTSQVIQIFPASIQVDYMDKNVDSAFKDTKSIYVTSNLPIKLVATNQLSDSSSEDAFAVLPICQLGTSYIAVVDESAGSSMDQATNIITVIATQDNTAVDMSPVVAQVVTINAGEQVSVAVKALINSLYIQANKPVAVISGAVCGYGFEDNPIHCSHEALMLYPLVDFGTEYPVFKYLPESRGDIIIFFTQNKTTLKGDQEVVGLFGPEVYLVVTVDPGVFISTDKPIYTAQFGNVNAQDQGAPFLAHVTPPNLFTSGPVTFATGYTQDETDNMVHYVRVVTDLNNIGSLIVQNFAKGTTVQPNGLLYRRMGVSTYYFVDVQVPRGQYTVSSALSSAKFSVTVYGYGQYRSYAYNAGLDLPVTGIC